MLRASPSSLFVSHHPIDHHGDNDQKSRGWVLINAMGPRMGNKPTQYSLGNARAKIKLVGLVLSLISGSRVLLAMDTSMTCVPVALGAVAVNSIVPFRFAGKDGEMSQKHW